MSGIEIIVKLKRRYTLLRSLETLLFSIGAGLLMFAVVRSFASLNTSLLISIGAASISFLFRFIFLNLHKTESSQIVKYLNANYSSLSHSADLLIFREELSTLKLIQRSKADQALADIYTEIKLPHKLAVAAATVLAATLLVFAFSRLDFIFTPGSRSNLQNDSQVSQTSGKAEKPAALKKVSITITPPAYTRLKQTVTNDLNIVTVEGSKVSWRLAFEPAPEKLSLKTSDGRNLKCVKSGNVFSATTDFTESGFYHLEWMDSLLQSSDYFKIDISPDAGPKISVKDLPQFVELELDKQSTLRLQCTITDDFGVTNAYIIATVSKGSGESVKFREEKLTFNAPNAFNKTYHHAERKLDFHELGMEPGDELYFYVEAFDNKAPTPNKTRTDTYFIALRDTAELYAVDDSGLGVDLMPEYFRSQRQIIIDTEKLLREKKKLGKKEFNFTSNELGYDQKVLRLRYGQFMGEEFESELLETTPLPEDEVTTPQEEEDPLAAVTHDHDTENEHNLVAEPDHEEDEEDPLAKYTHKHDDTETATFFTQTIRNKLKAALTQMWDAELYLRLFQPEKSLPYQYKALELLKEISNDSRIYVHKTGFDAPPIKEEKRLTGELKDVFSSSEKTKFQTEDRYPAIRKSLEICEAILQRESPLLSSNERQIFTSAGNELATIAVEQPALIAGLSVVRRILDNNTSADNLYHDVALIRQILWRVIPGKPSQATTRKQSLHSLDMQLLEELKSINE